jgi:hypothetical protein
MGYKSPSDILTPEELDFLIRHFTAAAGNNERIAKGFCQADKDRAARLYSEMRSRGFYPAGMSEDQFSGRKTIKWAISLENKFCRMTDEFDPGFSIPNFENLNKKEMSEEISKLSSFIRAKYNILKSNDKDWWKTPQHHRNNHI